MKKQLSILMLLAAFFVPWVANAQDCTQPVPYEEGFETTTAATSYSSSTGSIPTCWNFFSNGTSASYNPKVVSGSSSYVYRRSGNKSLVMTSGSEGSTYGSSKVLLLPPLATPLNQLQISFWMCTESSSIGELTLGYVTGNDATTFQAIRSWSASSDTYHGSSNGLLPNNGLSVNEQSLASVPATATRLAFKWTCSGTTSFFSCCIDDIFVETIPTCPRVGAVTARPGIYDVTVSWSGAPDSATAFEVNIYGSDENVAATTIAAESPVTLTGLAANTEYTAEVRVICGADTSLVRSAAFRTRCEAIATLPYSYGFEDANTSGATGIYNPCWSRHVEGSTTNYPHPYTTQRHSGMYSLYMYSASSAHSWTALPAFTENISNLYLNFWSYKTSAAYGYIAVGVMSDPDDIATFDTVKVIQVQALNTWEQFDVDFSTYTGTGSYIAFLAPKRSAANYAIIDDITVMETPTCVRPQAMRVEDVADATATVSWDPSPTGAIGYTVKYGTTDFDPETATDVTTLNISNGDTVANLTGLTGQTTYYVKVASNCGVAGTSLWTQTSFKTRCTAIATESLPYTYNVNDYTNTGATSTINACWTRGTNNSTFYPQASTTYKHGTSGRSLYFYSTSTYYSYAAMPAFEAPVNTLMLTFWAYKTSASYGHVTVGVMSNPDDISTFEPMVALQVSALSTWEKFEVPLVNYAVTGRYIALVAPQGSMNYVYVDDISVDEAPDCLPVEQLHISALSGTSATLEWTPAGNYTGFRVVYDSVSFNLDAVTNQTEEMVTSTSVTLSNLTANTTYYVYVQTLCTNGDTVGAVDLTFTTPCEAIETLPWTFEPDDLATTSSATDFECFGHLGGGYVNILASRTGFNGKVLRFFPNSSTLPNIFILPEFDEPLSNLYMTFVTAPEGTTSGSFSVGYITNPSDSTTFVELANYPRAYFYSTGALQPEMLDQLFVGAPDGARIAFRHNVDGTGWYWFLDEVKVMMMPTCFRPDSVIVSGIDATSATLNFHSSGNSDWLVVMPAFGCDSCDTSFVALGTTLDLIDLTPGTYYSGIVYALCNGDTSLIGTAFNFITSCVTLDLPVAFDAEGAWQGSASAPQRPCWDFLDYGSTSYNWRYSTTASNVHDGEKSYYYYGTTGTTYVQDDWMITPTIDFTGYEAVSMWVKTGSSTTTALYHGRISVYATVEDSTTSADTADFYRLAINGDSVNNNRVDFYGNTWQHLTINLPETLLGEHRLAFVVDTQCYTFYMDDIDIYTRAACPTVQDLAVVGLGSDTVRINWVDTSHVGNYIVTYWPDGNNLTADDTIAFPVTDTVVTIENLNDDAVYYMMVQTDCGDLSTPTYPISFRTRCVPIAASELPYVEDFESYNSGATNPISTCWTKGVFGSTTQYPYPYTSAAITGTRGLYFYSTSSIYDYAALPLFETDLNDLMLSFSMKRYNSSTYTTLMLVGVMSDPNDITTFDTVATFDLRNEPLNSVHRLLVSLENYDGNGSYIAFMAPKSSTTNYVYLDSVVVDSLPDCRWPSDLTVDTVTGTSATLSWIGTGSNFLVQASASPDFDSIVATATSTIDTATVTGLDDYTQYYFRVRAVCGDTSSFWSNTVSAITPLNCGADFETAHDTLSYGTSSGTSYVINGSSSYSYGASWHIYTAAELADLGMTDTLNYIRGISVETGTVSGSPIRFRVYMATTSLNEWHSSTSATSSTGVNDTLPISSMQLVYDGSVTFAANSWNDIAFSSSFLYNGEDNLVVAFVRDVPVSGTTNFKYGSTATYATAYKYIGSSTFTSRAKYGANMAFLTCNHVTNCPKPLDVVFSNAAADGFDVAWTGSAEGYTVVVSMAQIDPTTAVASDSVMILTPTTNQVSVSGLAPQTTYYVYLRSDCGTEHSTWATGGSIMTLCTAKTIPFHENFDGMASLWTSNTSAMVGGAPPCWNMFSVDAGSYISLYNASAYLYGGSGYSIMFKSGSSNVSNHLIMPEFTQPISVLEVSFQTRPEGTSASTGVFDVGYMTDPTDTATFVVTDHYSYSEFSGAYQEKSVTFPNAPAGARIAFRHTPISASYWWFIDEIDVHLAPTCPRPDSVNVSMLADGSAKVKWVDHRNSNISYEVEYGEVGFEHGYGASLIATTDSVVITDLANSRHYEVYVRALCSADDHSTWTSPVSFATPCGAVSLPYSIDWEYEPNGSSADLPLCWQRFNNATGSTNYYPYINTGTNAHNGNKFVYYYFYNSSGYANDEAFISPAIDTANYPINNIEVSFWAKSSVADMPIMVGVMSGNENMGTFTLIDTVHLTTTYSEYLVNTAAYTGNGDRIVLRCMMEGTSSYYIYLDEVYIGEIPPCPRVYNLTATDATQSTVKLGWTNPDSTVTSWVVEYNEFVPNAPVHTVTATSNPFTLTGLTPTTLYTYRVAPVCASGDTSFYSHERMRFTTSQVPATLPYSYNFENAAEWANWQISSNNSVNWYRGNVAEGNNTNSMYLSADGGVTHSWNMNTVTNAVAYRDIDFGSEVHGFKVEFDAYIGGTIGHNYDGIAIVVSDPTLPVQSSNTALNSPWGHVNTVGYGTTRRDTLWGHHTIYLDSISGVKRVAFYHFNQATGNNYEYYDNPSAVDNISITQQECERPTTLVVERVTSGGADLRWDGDSTANYQVRYRKQDGTTYVYAHFTGTSGHITELESSTPYYCWVRKLCTDSLVSGWTSSVSFVTEFCGMENATVIGDTSSTTTQNNTPVNNFYKYSLTETIIDSAELVGLSEINMIGFYYDYTTPMSKKNNVTIYLQPTTKSEFSIAGTSAAVTDAEPLDSMRAVKVYEGDLNCTQGWNYFTFSTPYIYSGSGNLMLIVDDNTNDYDGSSYKFKTSATEQYKTFALYSDSYNPDVNAIGTSSYTYSGTKSRYLYRVVMQLFNGTCVCEAPVMGALDTTFNSATVNWTDGDSSEVRIVEGLWNGGLNGTSQYVTTHTAAFVNLTPATLYTIGVRNICAEDMYSDWVLTTFTTPIRPCPLPTGLTAVPDYNSATISWTAGSDEAEWTLRVVRELDHDTSYYTCETASYTLTGLPVGMTYNVAVKATCDAASGSESDYTDAISFSTLTCEKPTDVTVTPGATSATVTWTGTADSYQVNWGLYGFPQGTGEMTTVSENTVVINGLDPETDYSVFVLAICDEGIVSEWSTRVNFTTEEGSVTTYTVTVNSNNDAWGTVSGGGPYESGATAILVATPNQGYQFVQWNDGNTQATRSITVTANVTYTATFAPADGIDDVNGASVSLYPNPANTMVTIDGIEGEATVTVVDMNGRTVYSQKAAQSLTIDLTGYAKGAYFVRVTGERVNAIRKLIVR